MILINLLPHRELARQRARQLFRVALGLSVLVGALIAGAIYIFQQQEIDRQRERNALLAGEIKQLEQQIKEVATLQEEIAALKARQEAVENLQADRNLPVHLLNEVVRQLPDGMVMRSLKQDNQAVVLTGAAQSNERVSELLRNLSRHGDRVTRPELVEIVAANLVLSPKEQRRVHNFVVRAQLQRSADAQPVAAPAGTASAERATVQR